MKEAACYITLPTLMMHCQTQIKLTGIFVVDKVALGLRRHICVYGVTICARRHVYVNCVTDTSTGSHMCPRRHVCPRRHICVPCVTEMSTASQMYPKSHRYVNRVTDNVHSATPQQAEPVYTNVVRSNLRV